jgi:hypothetical protein
MEYFAPGSSPGHPSAIRPCRSRRTSDQCADSRQAVRDLQQSVLAAGSSSAPRCAGTVSSADTAALCGMYSVQRRVLRDMSSCARHDRMGRPRNVLVQNDCIANVPSLCIQSSGRGASESAPLTTWTRRRLLIVRAERAIISKRGISSSW